MSIVLTDNAPIPKEFQNRCKEIQGLLDEDHYSLINLLAWEKEQNQGAPQIINELGNKTGNYVGLFEYHSGSAVEQVIIGDRFGPKAVTNNGADCEFLSFFSWNMLESCWNDTPLWLLNEYRANGEIDILDKLLILRLAAQLGRAWKKGLFRLYRSFSRYDYQIRGQLDIPRKIRMSMGLDDGKMAYRVREYSEDNIYNQLFLQACLEAEKRQPKLMRNLENRMPDYRTARKMLESLSPSGVRPDTRSLLNRTKKKITNPVYRDYETLRGIARVVLKRSSHRSYPYAESGAPFVTGIFLDISKLWEDYLTNAVFKNLSAQPITQKYISILKEPAPKNSAPKNLLYIKPDFWWKAEKRVLDAKFRPAWAKALNSTLKNHKGIQKDVYQVLSYMLTLDCTHGGVIFPVSEENKNPAITCKALHAVEDNDARSFWLIPFYVPGSDDYQTFSSDMEAEAGRVCDEVENFLMTT